MHKVPVYLHSEVPTYSFKNKKVIKDWLKTVIQLENKVLGVINVIVVSDEELLDINKKFLKQDYFTDVITFNYNEKDVVSGDIYISLDRINENAKKLKDTPETEFHRVIVHGVLHLLGYDDKTSKQKVQIRSKEDVYLQILT